MSEQVDKPILEYLKRFQTGQDRIESKLDEVVIRLGQLEVATASVKGGIAHGESVDASLSIRLDTAVKRIDRIEKRLELA
ncbi:MAG: hypothetical protein Q8M20_10715 [Rhodocyclaceae bacterium]|nr:hypothetical protein [Rhodocyclaceae bacterium]MDZ4215360.1 hypothetical protein [Rhodocyclaceae bacterium]